MHVHVHVCVREREERRGKREGMHVCELVCVSMHNTHLLHPQVLFHCYRWYLATS